MLYTIVVILAVLFIGLLLWTMNRNADSAVESRMVLPGEDGEDDQVIGGLRGGKTARTEKRVPVAASKIEDENAWQQALANVDEEAEELPEDFRLEDETDSA